MYSHAHAVAGLVAELMSKLKHENTVLRVRALGTYKYEETGSEYTDWTLDAYPGDEKDAGLIWATQNDMQGWDICEKREES